MKILIVHNYYKIPGGEDTVVKAETELLRKNGHEVILYTRSNDELSKFSGIRKLKLPFMTVFNRGVYKDIRGLIKKEDIEIVHVHNTLNVVSPSVYYAALKEKVPVVQTIHNFRLLCPGALFLKNGCVCEECLSKGVLHAVKNKCYRGSRLETLAVAVTLLIHRATGIYKKINYICLTDFNKEKMLNMKGIRPEKIFVKPNFMPADTKFSEDSDEYYIYAARLEEAKGIRVLLDAFSDERLRNRKLMIIGSGPLLEECREIVLQKDLSNVTLKGQVPNETAKELISKARALILPTLWYEGFPMTIVESYSKGTPVIASNIGNPAVLVEEGITGTLFNVGDKSSLADAVMRIEDFKNIRDTTYQTFLTKYSSEKNYEMLMKIYGDVLK